MSPEEALSKVVLKEGGPVHHLGSCIGVWYAVSDRVLWSKNISPRQHFKFIGLYNVKRNPSHGYKGLSHENRKAIVQDV
jgi:hypothetical protein